MYEYYIISMLAILACGLLCGLASAKVSKAYNRYGRIATRSRMTGYDTARRLLTSNGATDISIGRVGGHLSDHYHPTKRIVNLSDSTYDNASVAAVARYIGEVLAER
jgi:Zn-dependent membrane protease YugP